MLDAQQFDGVVYLDRDDRKMILLRGGRVAQLSQCGLPAHRRFTFYDQVHTTGMDIAQAPGARAVVTIGKDMTFRDYAQGTFRMRGIGQGQTITVMLIPEVRDMIKADSISDIACWLIINGMLAEKLQHGELCVKEINNVWRKTALEMLKKGKRMYVEEFRETIGFPVMDTVPCPEPIAERMRAEAEQKQELAVGREERIEAVLGKLDSTRYCEPILPPLSCTKMSRRRKRRHRSKFGKRRSKSIGTPVMMRSLSRGM